MITASSNSVGYVSLGLQFTFILAFKPSHARAQFFDGNDYFAPPLETATLAVTALDVLLTLVQLIILLSFLCRGRASHMGAAVVVIVGTLFLFISYVMGAVDIVVAYTTWGVALPLKTRRAIGICATLFSLWTDPVILLGVALIIRDRYAAYHKTDSGLVRFVAPAIVGFLALLVFIFASAYVGVRSSFPTLTLHPTEDEIHAYEARIRTMIHVDYARASFFLVATVFLLAFAIAAKLKVKSPSDRILNVTLFGLVPLEILSAIATVISTVYYAKIGQNFTPAIFKFDFAETFVFGFLYFFILSILCYFYLNSAYWNWPDEKPNYNTVGPLMMPVAQFPGQWGYTGQQQQYYGVQVPYTNSQYHTHPPSQPATAATSGVPMNPPAPQSE